MNKWYFWLAWLMISLLPGEAALAHGVKIQYLQSSAITVRATYDDGTPMKEAQVVVYAPNDLANPWLKGITDERGYFSFVPDADISGNWDVKVRQSGHGDIVSIPLTEGNLGTDNTQEMTVSGTTNDYSPLQKMVMAAAGVWGFIGTALFFSRKKS
ncbi:MAG: carboxypeptidase regulatory-like domain-containing protein [Pleurocapsa sp.]